MFVYIYVYKDIEMYIYICIYKHTYIHTYKHHSTDGDDARAAIDREHQPGPRHRLLLPRRGRCLPLGTSLIRNMSPATPVRRMPPAIVVARLRRCLEGGGWGSGFRVEGLGVRMQGLEIGVWCVGLRDEG